MAAARIQPWALTLHVAVYNYSTEYKPGPMEFLNLTPLSVIEIRSGTRCDLILCT